MSVGATMAEQVNDPTRKRRAERGALAAIDIVSRIERVEADS